MSSRVHCGLFIGGKGSRMGGAAKGLLRTNGGGPTLLEHLVSEFASACPMATLALVGERDEYVALGLPMLADATQDVGPIGGLHALLLDADARGANQVIALACDLPYLKA